MTAPASITAIFCGGPLDGSIVECHPGKTTWFHGGIPYYRITEESDALMCYVFVCSTLWPAQQESLIPLRVEKLIAHLCQPKKPETK